MDNWKEEERRIRTWKNIDHVGTLLGCPVESAIGARMWTKKSTTLELHPINQVRLARNICKEHGREEVESLLLGRIWKKYRKS